jgi:hypothetical protein
MATQTSTCCVWKGVLERMPRNVPQATETMTLGPTLRPGSKFVGGFFHTEEHGATFDKAQN